MEFDSYFFLVTKYQLMVVGLWPKVGSFKILYFIYSILVRSYFTFYMITFISGTIIALPSMTSYQRADILTYCLVYLLAAWKIFLVRKKSIKILINDAVVFEKNLKGTNPDLEAIYKNQSKANFKSIIYLPLTTCFCYYFFLNATLTDFFEWKSLEEQGIESGKHLIFTQLLPYPEKYFGYYYVYQMTAAFVAACYGSLVDSLILTLINYTIMQFQILGVEMKNIFENKERDLKETKAALRNKILVHKAIISHVAELNKNLKWYFLTDFTLKSYQMSLVLLAFFDEATYLIPRGWILFKLSQIPVMFAGFVVLYFQANKVTTESEELNTAIYKSDWIGQPVEITRCLMIMMARAKKGLKIESFGMVILSSNLLLKICQAAYTYVVVQLAKHK